MRISSLGLLALLPALSYAGAIAGIAGMIDNSAEASQLQAAAGIAEGSYMVRNVATGQVLTYGRDGNHVTPGGDGTPVSVMHHGGTSWARLQIGDKNKCLSSQWGGSYNHAGVMYHCAVDVGGEVTRLENTLEPTKQWWLIVPVRNHDYAGNHDNAALVAAQQLSVKTREKAMGISKRAQGFGLSSGSMVSRRYANAELAQDDLSKRAAAPDWRERILAARRKHVAGRQAARDASKSKPDVTKAKPAVKIALKEAPKGVNKGVSLNVKPQNKPAIEVEEEEVSPPVPTGDRYFIIPTDHLLDMHTLALTGHQIESAGNTQSTALDAWNAADPEQQWIFTRV